MAFLLAVESSTTRASLALLRDGEVVFEDGFESDRRHHSLIFAPIQAALALLGGDALEAVVIGTGPGSYSGTRVGIAAGQGVAMVHGCPAVGLSSLLALGQETGMVIGDARRGSAWWAKLGDGLPQPELIPAQELAGRLGEGPVFSMEDVSALGLEREVAFGVPTAAALGRAWQGLSADVRAELENEPPQPAYLRPPHITQAKKGHPLLRDRH